MVGSGPRIKNYGSSQPLEIQNESCFGELGNYSVINAACWFQLLDLVVIYDDICMICC